VADYVLVRAQVTLCQQFSVFTFALEGLWDNYAVYNFIGSLVADVSGFCESKKPK
jgi:hypothetical protein